MTDPAASGSLVSSLQVEPSREKVHFVYQVTNVSANAVPLTFPSGQSFDVVVTAAGQERWRWSADRAFTQAVRDEPIPPGETVRFTAEWAAPPGTTGDLVARAYLSAMEHRAEQQTAFRLP
jgi:hypothetical protein